MSETDTPKRGLFGRLRESLSRTRDGMANAIIGAREVDKSLLEDIETALLGADVGIDATDVILSDLNERLRRREMANPAAVVRVIRENMVRILEPVSVPLEAKTPDGSPFVVLMIGVNGAGKTTTIGKLASRWSREGRSVMMAAGDTFRAAAVEQLKGWGERTGVPVISQHTGADSASVLFDALTAARARGADVLLADTAGRLHTRGGLMDELRKVRRVLWRIDDAAPHEVLLVLDATTGQNGLIQAQEFHNQLGATGIVLTKLDGTARGGVILAIAKNIGLPIRFIGVGEGVDDLRPFDAGEFVDAILSGIAE